MESKMVLKNEIILFLEAQTTKFAGTFVGNCSHL